MKNLKRNVKIGIGFGGFIVIACVLGGMAVWDMERVSQESTRLKNEYVSEADVVAVTADLSANPLARWQGCYVL